MREIHHWPLGPVQRASSTGSVSMPWHHHVCRWFGLLARQFMASKLFPSTNVPMVMTRIIYQGQFTQEGWKRNFVRIKIFFSNYWHLMELQMSKSMSKQIIKLQYWIFYSGYTIIVCLFTRAHYVFSWPFNGSETMNNTWENIWYLFYISI